MSNEATGNLLKLIVVITLCIALLTVVGLAYAGKVDPNAVVTFILTAFASLAGGAAGVGLTERGSRQGVNTALNVMRAESEREK